MCPTFSLYLSNFSPPLTLPFALIQAGVRLPFSPFVEREVSFVCNKVLRERGMGRRAQKTGEWLLEYHLKSQPLSEVHLNKSWLISELFLSGFYLCFVNYEFRPFRLSLATYLWTDSSSPFYYHPCYKVKIEFQENDYIHSVENQEGLNGKKGEGLGILDRRENPCFR